MKRQMLTCCIILIVCTGILPLAGAHTATPAPRPLTYLWSDNFDSYQDGQRLDGTPDDGGWKGWDNISTSGSTVTDTQAQSTPNANLIQTQTDVVHEFLVTSGPFTFTAWQYIPENFSGKTYFILLSHYQDNGSKNYAVTISADAATNMVESENDAMTLPLKKGRWVELRTEANLTSDWFTVYYDNELLVQKHYSNQCNNTGGGPLTLQAIDLRSTNATAAYYDDLSLSTPEIQYPPVLLIQNVTGGPYLTAVIRNVGQGTATNVTWVMILSNGFILSGAMSTGFPGVLIPGAQDTMTCNRIIGIGRVIISFSATCAEGATTSKIATGFVFLIFVLNVK